MWVVDILRLFGTRSNGAYDAYVVRRVWQRLRIRLVMSCGRRGEDAFEMGKRFAMRVGILRIFVSKGFEQARVGESQICIAQYY